MRKDRVAPLSQGATVGPGPQFFGWDLNNGTET